MTKQNSNQIQNRYFKIGFGRLISQNNPYSMMTFLYHTDQELYFHSVRVERICKQIGLQLGFPSRAMSKLCFFARLHDLGKLFISNDTLYKPGPLNNSEYSLLQQHSVYGYTLVKQFPQVEDVGSLVLKHHEWWNGTGYPLGLKEDAIPLECRILAIADAFDAMTNDRPYRKAVSKSQAVKELQRCAGEQFDPYLVNFSIKMMACDYYSSL